jgi:hypothetical protein
MIARTLGYLLSPVTTITVRIINAVATEGINSPPEATLLHLCGYYFLFEIHYILNTR